MLRCVPALYFVLLPLPHYKFQKPNFCIFAYNLHSMPANEPISIPLNEQQMIMLRLLKNPLPEADFIQMRRLAVQLLSKRLDEVVEVWELENNVTAETYEALSKQHFRTSSKNAE